MGTSAARQPPRGRYWRRAKTALGRFAANQGAAPKAAEVVAHYGAALHFEAAGSGRELLAVLATSAMNLADFYRTGLTQGWPGALERLGVLGSTPQNPQSWWPQLVERLAGVGASLAQATARAALIHHFAAHFDLSAPCPRAGPAGGQPEQLSRLVVDYLGRFLALSLQVDLGEVLEYRAPDIQTARRCLAALQEAVLTRLPKLAAPFFPLAMEPENPQDLREKVQTLLALLAREAGDE